MGREARRAQARAERRQRRQRQQPTRQRAQQAALSGGAAAETARGGGSLFKPRWATDIINELRRVTWPARGEVGYLTVVVIIVSLAIGAFLGLADVGFGWFIENTILNN
jgi:preprotein translocase SecE subunit